MKIKTLLLIIAAAATQLLFAQAPDSKAITPDFKSMEKIIKDKASAFYYPALLKRYKSSDTTLNAEEYSYLYYGFSFQDNYSPYGKSDYNDELKRLLEKEELSDSERDKIIELEKKVLEKYPFNLRNIYTLITMLKEKGDTTGSAVQLKKLTGIAKTIISTGNGTTDSTAMYVISVEHEYDMIGLLGYQFGGSQSLVYSKHGELDKLQLKKNDDEVDSLYFNVERLFASTEKLFKKNK